MTTLLKINTSARADGNASRLADELVAAWMAAQPGTRLISHDYGRDPLPHLGEAEIDAFFTPAEQRSPSQRETVRLSDGLVAELQAADVLVLGVPMYNFGIPSTLKAYFDRVARAGITDVQFIYAEGLNINADSRAAAEAGARQQIRDLVAA